MPVLFPVLFRDVTKSFQLLIPMDAPGTAIEQYFNQLINMGLLSQVIVSDRQGNTILACFGQLVDDEAGDHGEGGGDDEDGNYLMESNVALSGARCFQNLEQLQLGVPEYITAQYHDAMAVQTLDENCLVTLIGHRSRGHSVGSLLALRPQIRSAGVYVELLQKIAECFQ